MNMITYIIDKSESEPVYIQIYNQMKSDIESGKIQNGEKLPSKRTFAANLGVSIITVENAYAQLAAEGYIRSVPKKGYFAEKIAAPLSEKTVKKKTEELKSSAQQFPENDKFPFALWARLMREELSVNQKKLLVRPPGQGVYELREAISEHLKSFRNMNVSPDRIVIGAGTEYLYLLINVLFGGNYVFGIEDPGYRKISDIYRSINIRCEFIPMLENGIDTDFLKSRKIDIVHISPSHHFPTGTVTSIGKRYALLEWASESPDRYIIEDDYDSELRLSGKPVPSMFSIDAIDKVIYMNTFSRSLSSTIRISYMILPESLMSKFSSKLSLYSCTVSNFEQYTLARFISEGYFEKHINRMRKYYRECRDNTIERLKKCCSEYEITISGEDAGLHCVVNFNTDKTDEDMLERLREYGFKARSVSEFYCSRDSECDHSFIIYY